MTRFNLPDLGEGLQEAEIVQWHVSPGDHIVGDQPLVSVETDKAVVEIPAPYSGTVGALLVEAGDVVPTGAPIIELDTGQAEDTGAIVGDISPPPLPPEPQPAPEPTAVHPSTIQATPAVRKLALEKGVDLSDIKGSGPGGAILSSDVTASAAGDGEKLRGVRLAMASAMAASHASVVPATLTDNADINAWEESEMPMVRLVQAMTFAVSVEPALNAWFDNGRRMLHGHLDLAIAVDTTAGLFAPVLRNAGDMTNLEQRLAKLRQSVEQRTVARADMKGGTITLSNFGTLGGIHAALVITPPQVAILGAGRISEACQAVNGKPVVRRIMPLSLTFDHRVVTGGEAARFMNAVRQNLEQERADQGDTA